jgi:hypothetical protein
LYQSTLRLGAAALLLAGCGGSPVGSPQGGQINPNRTQPGAKTGYLYVANESGYGPSGEGSILIFSQASSGNVAPVGVIAGSNTQLTQVNGIAVDPSGEIYVVDTDKDKIVGFAAGSTGNVSPNVVISGSATGLAWPIGLALDDDGNLYVANCGSGCKSGLPAAGVLEFAAGSNGNASPLRNISGSNTQLTRSNGVAWRGDVYVSQTSSIVVFNGSANGNATPSRIISGSKTGLNDAWGVTADKGWVFAGSCVNNSIARFRYRAAGDVAPAAVISGGKTRLDSCVDGISVAQRGQVYGVTINSNPAVVGFFRMANGNVRADTYIAGSNTDLTYPAFVFASPQYFAHE